jgi:hypothetical protein
MIPVSRRFSLGITAAIAILAFPFSAAQGQCCMNKGGGMSMGMGMPQGMGQLMQQLLMQQQLLLSQQKLPYQQPQANPLQQALQQVANLDEIGLKDALKDKRETVRYAAVLKIGEKDLPLQDELIDLLTDPNDAVRQMARRSLIKLSLIPQKNKARSEGRRYYTPRRIDFGPAANASEAAQSRAAAKWRQWWDKNTVPSTEK